MARQFVAASSQRIDFSTSLGNWERTQAFSVSVWIKTSSNVGGTIIGKEDATANIRGWEVFHRAGTTSPQFALELSNVSASNRLAVRTTSEFTTGVWRHVVFTYDGSSTVAGCHIYVDNVDQALTTIVTNLTATILSADVCQIGCRGGATRTSFCNGFLRRLSMYTAVLSSGNVATLFAGTSMILTNCVLWQEFGAFNDGASVVADWSENNNIGFVTGATYQASDPAITALTPNLGTSGGRTLSGPLTRMASPPMLQNLGWAGGANTGVADQIGPGVIIKNGPGDYRGWFENDTGAKSLDVGNQTGTFDFDTPTIYGTSVDGLTWTLNNQNVPASAIFTCNNLGGNSTFKAAVKGETSISALFYDPDDLIWKCWFHGGNNSGVRSIYYATCSGDPTGANWTVQNSGVAVLAPGTGWESDDIADAHVIRVNSSLMVMLYRGLSSSVSKIGYASSTDRGLTWTKYGSNPVFGLGAAGSWNAIDVYPAAFIYDAALGLYLCWLGGRGTGSADQSIGFAYSADAITWTMGPFNPVHNQNTVTSGANAYEFTMASTLSIYLDGSTYRIMYKADNGVGGTTGFRGRIEATIQQIVQLTSRNLQVRQAVNRASTY